MGEGEVISLLFILTLPHFTMVLYDKEKVACGKKVVSGLYYITLPFHLNIIEECITFGSTLLSHLLYHLQNKHERVSVWTMI